ncbi:ATP-binding protein [uncultured Chryseobacterium sp.]|uniref:ATP-binding protein n=1 Tax=uncultured Chryseobacterium sp. TaxID=259322 RepID=UPI0026080061|nr:ATP-binding protein [uncultured Chryseobacterium sp.]
MKRWIYDKSSFFLILIFVVATALIFFLMGLTYKHLEKLSDSTGKVIHSYEVSLTLETLYSQMKDIETQKRNYILTHDPSIIYEVSDRKDKINESLVKLRKLIRDNPEQIENANMLGKMIQYKYKIIGQAFSENITTQDTDQLKLNLLAGKNIMASISDKIEEMVDIERVLMEQRKDEFGTNQKTTPLFIYLIALFALGLLSFAFYKIFKDVKEQRNSNRSLQLSLNSSKLAEMVGNFGIWTLDYKTDSYTFSDNEYRLLGYRPQEFVATYDDFVKHVHPDDLEYVHEQSQKFFTEKSHVSFTYRIFRKDGVMRYFEASGKTIVNKEGEKILLGITTDVTDKIGSKKTLEEQNRILEAANKDLLAFNYVASHDLQEPLRKIETFISRLNDKDGETLSESGKMYLDRMKSAAGRMRVLIEDLLQFSRTTRAEKVFEKADLNTLMDHSLEELQHVIAEKDAMVKVDKLPVMNIIPFQIQQMFTNLVNNSLKYSKEDVVPEIRITSERVRAEKDENIPQNAMGEFYKFTITDNGIGFEQEFAEKIFVVFNRLHNKSEYAGTGIGLAVCKRIVENHGGYIFAEGFPNKGSKFTVYLPIRA